MEADRKNYNKTPFVDTGESRFDVIRGWDAIVSCVQQRISQISKPRKIVVIETYQGVCHSEVGAAFRKGLSFDDFIESTDYMLAEDMLHKLLYPYITDHPVFGTICPLDITSFFDATLVGRLKSKISLKEEGTLIFYGPGAAYLAGEPDLIVYADMARWEIQQRMRQGLVCNVGFRNRSASDWMLHYKQGFFVDWRVCDRIKQALLPICDYVLDTNRLGSPAMIEGAALLYGLHRAVQQPISLVPFFDPGPWGGQWMKQFCRLDQTVVNYAWCFNCVPEENSLYLKYSGELFETPAINLVFFFPRDLLGNHVYNLYGAEFPIRFDFLDTMGGGNLSLQVHPDRAYIKQHFGMQYTQEESYYILDCEQDATVFLGLRSDVVPEEMMQQLDEAQKGDMLFQAERYVQSWPVRKHDHLLIPAGTVHCSGKNSMVLEISSTPYIFTFKLWDWGRLGLDGKPRPISLEHGKQVIQWNRTTEWTRKQLINRVEILDRGVDWVEERTGLEESQPIETRRFWFSACTEHQTEGNVHVLCLVHGLDIVVESPDRLFAPFTVHYAEVFIVPAVVERYILRVLTPATDGLCAVVKAYIRM